VNKVKHYVDFAVIVTSNFWWSSSHYTDKTLWVTIPVQ